MTRSAFVPTTSLGRVEELGAVVGQLIEQDPLLLGCRHTVEGGDVDEQTQDPRPLDVAEEPVAETLAFTRPFDQPGDVGDDELGVVVDAHHPEVGFERRERVVGDLRLGRRDDTDQRALADVGEPDESNVGHQLQLEFEPALLPVLTLFGERRSATLVGEEAGVAPPAPAAGGGTPAIAVVPQLGEHFAGVQVAHHRPLRDGDDLVVPTATVHVLALAVDAAAGAAVRVVAKGQQRRDVVIGDEPHVASPAAVATVRPALGDGPFPTKRDAARSPVTAAHVELRLVDELGHLHQPTNLR